MFRFNDTSAPSLSQVLHLRQHVTKIKKLQTQGKMEIRTVCEESELNVVWMCVLTHSTLQHAHHGDDCVPARSPFLMLVNESCLRMWKPVNIAISLLLTNRQLHSICCHPKSVRFGCNSASWTCMKHCSTHNANAKVQTTKWRATFLRRLLYSVPHRFRLVNEISEYVCDTNTHSRH